MRLLNRTGGDEQLVAWLGMVNHPGDLELHSTFEHGHQLVGLMREVLPLASRRIDPQLATEPALGPVGGDLVGVNHLTGKKGRSYILFGSVALPPGRNPNRLLYCCGGLAVLTTAPCCWLMTRTANWETAPMSSVFRLV